MASGNTVSSILCKGELAAARDVCSAQANTEPDPYLMENTHSSYLLTADKADPGASLTNRVHAHRSFTASFGVCDEPRADSKYRSVYFKHRAAAGRNKFGLTDNTSFVYSSKENVKHNYGEMFFHLQTTGCLCTLIVTSTAKQKKHHLII